MTKANIYNFYDRAIPEFLKKGDLVYHQPTTTVLNDNVVLAASTLSGKKLVVDQNTETLLDFIKAYYEFLEEKTNPHDIIKNWNIYRDIDTRLKHNDYDYFLNRFKSQYLPHIPSLINSSFLIPTKLDLLYYKKEYLNHLLSLSSQKRYDRFKKILSNYQIEEIISELTEEKDEKKRILFVFTDFTHDVNDIRIVAACHLAIDLNQGIAEAAISIEDHQETSILVRQFIVYCLRELKQYSAYLENFYVNYMTNDELLLQYGKFIGANNTIYLIENDEKFLQFNLFDNDQTYELYYEADITKNYKILFNFETNADFILNYSFVDTVPSNYKILLKEQNVELKEKIIDGGTSATQFNQRIHGFTSQIKLYAEVENGGNSVNAESYDFVKLPLIHKQIKILGETRYLQTLDVQNERWPIDAVIYHTDLTATIRFFNNLPLDLQEFPSVYIADETIQVGPLMIFDIEESAFKVQSYELTHHLDTQQKWQVIFNRPINYIKLNATLKANAALDMYHTRSKGVLIFDKESILTFPNETINNTITAQIDTTGYFVENSNYDKLPNNYDINSEFIIKHIKEFYLKKGSKLTYEFLFKLLFNENINVYSPKVHMLTSSDTNFTKEHVLFAKDILNWNALKLNDMDGIFYGLSQDNNTVCFGQLLASKEISLHYDIELPKFKIVHIEVNNHDTDARQSFFRVIIADDNRMDNYIGGKISIQIENVIPTMFNGYFIAQVESRTELLIYSFHTLHKRYDQYLAEGRLSIDDRFYRSENFICFTTMMEFLEINYETLKNFAIVDQSQGVTYFSIKIGIHQLVDFSLLLDDQFQEQPLYLLNEALEPLITAKIINYSVEKNLDISANTYFYLLLKIDEIFTQFNSIFAIKIKVDSYNFIIEPIVKDSVLLADTLSENTFEIEKWKKYDYLKEDVLPIYDNHGLECSSAIISSLNEITKKITSLSFESVIPHQRYRTYVYDSQQTIDKDFERLDFDIALDTLLVEITQRTLTETGIIITIKDPIDSIIIGTLVDFDIRAEGEPTLLDLLHSDIDEVHYDSLNCQRSPLLTYDKHYDLNDLTINYEIGDITLPGFVLNARQIEFSTITERAIFFRSNYMTYDEILVDENKKSIEGWCRLFFSNIAYSQLNKIFEENILKSLFEQDYKDMTVFKTWNDFNDFMKKEENFEELYQATLPYRNLIINYIKTWKTLQFSVPSNIDDKEYLLYNINYLTTNNYLLHIFHLIYDYLYVYNTEQKFPIVIDNTLCKKLELCSLSPNSYIAYDVEAAHYIIDEHQNPLVFSDQNDIGNININFFRYGPFIKGIVNDFDKEMKINYLTIFPKSKTACRLFNKYINTTGLNKSCLQDNFYYQMFSYEIGSDLPIDRYKFIVTGLLHPVGTQLFSRMLIFNHQSLNKFEHFSESSITATLRNTDFPILSQDETAIFANEKYFVSYKTVNQNSAL